MKSSLPSWADDSEASESVLDGPVWLSRPVVAVLAAMLTQVPTQVVANDSTFGGRGSDLIPLQETRVQMVSEDIIMELVPLEDAWHITAKYQFHNPTRQAVTLQMGFPEELCREDQDCTPYGGRFRDLNTKVRDVFVEQREGRVQEKEPWAEHLGRVFLYDVTFQAGETVEVIHQYAMDRSYGVDWWGVRYLTRTGALWNGPIKHAKFTVRMPRPPWYVIFPRAFRVLSFKESPLKGARGTRTELVFEARDWMPKEDFTLSFPGPTIEAMSEHGLCLGYQGVDDPADLKALLSDYGDAQLKACRNLVYSLHGYPFKSTELDKLYYGQPKPWPMWADRNQVNIAVRPKNPEFKPEWLTLTEQNYIDAVVEEERRRGLR